MFEFGGGERSIAQLMRDSRRRSKSRSIEPGGMKMSGVKGRQVSFAVSSGIQEQSSMVPVSRTWSLRGQSMTLSIMVTRNGDARDKPTKTRGQMRGIVSLQRLERGKRQRQGQDGVPIMIDGRSLDARGKSTRY